MEWLYIAEPQLDGERDIPDENDEINDIDVTVDNIIVNAQPSLSSIQVIQGNNFWYNVGIGIFVSLAMSANIALTSKFPFMFFMNSWKSRFLNDEVLESIVEAPILMKFVTRITNSCNKVL